MITWKRWGTQPMNDSHQVVDLNDDSSYFLELQTNTGWGHVLRRFTEWIDPKSGWRTLDVGCGPGLLPLLLSQIGCHAAGIDLDPEMFKPAPVYHQVVIADGENPPFHPGQFDLVTLSNVLFLHDHPEHLLESIRNILTPNGQIALINPSEMLSVASATEFIETRNLEGLPRDSLLNFAQRAERHERWTFTGTRSILESNGYTIMDSRLSMGPGFVRFTRAHKRRR